MAEKLSEAQRDILRHCSAYGRYGAIPGPTWLSFRDECKAAFTECIALDLLRGQEVSERGKANDRYFVTESGRALLEGE